MWRRRLERENVHRIILITLFFLIWLGYEIKNDIAYNKMQIERSRYQIKLNKDLFLDNAEFVHGERYKNRLLHVHGYGYVYTLIDFKTAIKSLNYIIDNYREDYVGLYDGRNITEKEGGSDYLWQLASLSISLHRVLNIQEMMPGDDASLTLNTLDIETGENHFKFQVGWLAEEIKRNYKRWLNLFSESSYYNSLVTYEKREIKEEVTLGIEIDKLVRKAVEFGNNDK